MAELNVSHPGGHFIVSGNPSHEFAISDLIMQDDSHTVTSTVSASTNHDSDTQQSITAEEWNKVPGNRNSPSESGSTRSRTSSPAHDNGVTTSNQYNALSGNQHSNKKHKSLKANGPTESNNQEYCVVQQDLVLNVRRNRHYTPLSLRVSLHADSTNED
jgi:hypothetical protein